MADAGDKEGYSTGGGAETLTDEEKFTIREYVASLDNEKEEKRRSRVQFWVGALGLSAAVLISGLWFGINDVVKTQVNSEVERNQYIVSVQNKLNDSIDNLINARTKHADAQAVANVSLKESDRILQESISLLTKIKAVQKDLDDAQPILAATKNLAAYSDKVATDLSNNPKFISDVAQAAVVPKGAVVAFDNANGCPLGWRGFQAASGRVLIGATHDTSSLISYPYQSTGGAEHLRLTVAQLPTLRITYPVFRSGEFSLQNSGYPGYRFIGQAAREAAKGASGNVVSEQSDPIGSGEEIDIRPPFLAMFFCVKD
jgi:hypothetical protein